MADIRINALANTATTPASDDYLALDGAAQGTRKILATNIANNVTDVILGSSGPSVKSTLSARAPRQGLVFDGSSTSVGTVSIPAYGQSALTISGWAVWTGAQQGVILDGTNSIVAYVNGAGSFRIYSRPASADLVTTADGTIVANKWFHWAYNRDKIYINGVAASASAGDTQNYTGGTTSIGQNVFSADRWIGAISGPFIYNRALSASEVVALYEAGAPAGADYNSASNTAINTLSFADGVSGGVTCVASGGSFSGASATGFTAVGGGLAFAAVSAQGPFTVSPGQKITVTYTATVNSGTVGLSLLNGAVNGISNEHIVTTGTRTVELTATAYSTSSRVCFYGPGGVAFNVVVSGVSVVRAGLLLAPDAAQAGGGLTWYDTSGNAANITLPASGVSWNVPSSRVLGGNWTTSGNLTVSGAGTSSVAGQFGIGTSTTPEAKFESYQGSTSLGGWAFSSAFTAASYPLIRLGAKTPDKYASIGNDADGGFTFLTNGSASALGSTSAKLFANGNLFIGASPVDGGQKLQVSGSASFAGTVTTTSSFNTSTRTPGSDTAIQTLRADAANTEWPFQLSSIYDGGYVDNFAIFCGILGTGTRAAPKFTCQNGTGAWILRSFQGGDSFHLSRVAGSSTNASPTNILSFNSTGDATFAGNVGIGGTTPTTSGKGITFPATQSPSTDANTLDDYEEGPCSLSVSAGTGTITSYTITAYYTKIGRLVMINGYLEITNNGTGAGYLSITGLPFTSGYYASSGSREGGTHGLALSMIMNPSATTINVYKYDNSYPVATGSNVPFTFSYMV